MRILTVTNLYPPDVIGGYEIACGQMVRALRQRGHTVEVLTSRPRRPIDAEPGVSRTLRLTGWHVGPGAGPLQRRLMELESRTVHSFNVGVLLDALAAFEPEVVYLWNVHSVGAFGLAGALAHLQIPVVWHLMDDVPRAAVTVEAEPATTAAAALSRRLRARYVGCSQRLLTEIARGGFDFKGRAEILPNWVDTVPAPRDRSFYPHAGQPLRLVAASQLGPNKGTDVIIQTARRLVDHGHSGFGIDVYGTGDEEGFRRMIFEAGVSRMVRLRGFVEHADVVERHWDYDLFLLPTWKREPFAFAPLEAAVRGCVQLISQDCGNAEWFVGGVDCLKAPPTVEGFAAAIAAVLQGRTELEPIARRARATIIRSFQLAAVVPLIEQALEDARALPAVRAGKPSDTFRLARLAERLALDWAGRA